MMTVWDASCGVGNLISCRPFSSLIATTIHSMVSHLLDLIHYYMKSELFQDLDQIRANTRIRLAVDFLADMTVCDQIGDVLCQSDAILFLNNPPYKTVNEQVFNGRVQRPAGHTNTPVKQAGVAPTAVSC